ncbi:hypothetical protein SASPL_145222 [Salvia splendens]|uniref:Myb/SANT-like domain-containing protein n=1 Tax=Salvia splendens TaxID=180675 RepID=A0A8X8Z7W1_SALSN|nr:hypothetical protein SASPL_145222 [Salvia splendens]
MAGKGGLSSFVVNAFLGRSRRPKNDRTRRSCCDREEEILVVTLKDLSTQGWKSDNGFRAGYLGKLEEAVKRHCPDSDIKATPHIVSKITAWKRSYYLLQGILSRSGVGFNTDGDYKIYCDHDQWSQRWPHWQVIFGNDRANGEVSEDLREAEMEFDLGGNGGARGQQSANLEDISASGVGYGTKELVEDNTSMSEGGVLDTNDRIQSLSFRLGYEFNLSKAGKQVHKMLDKLPALSKAQKFDARELILH